MDDDGDEDDTKRRTRNLSEKKRRDQFNMLVNELSSMISTSNRKMDKSTILKLTISFLKNHNEKKARSRVYDVHEDWKPPSLSNEEFKYLVLEALEGFIMVISANGQIYYASENFTLLLGYTANDLVNKSIFEIAFEDDRANLYSLLQNHGTVSESAQTISDDNEINFQCHLRRRHPNYNNDIEYELIQFRGHFRTDVDQGNDSDASGFQQDRDSRLLFVCAGYLQTPQLIRDVSLVDSNRCEFTSRHSLEWKFLFLDHRAPPIIGYLPFEVLGTSGYDYYHFDDLEKVVSCHEALMQKGELTSCFYRFLTKGQQWIWLQTRFYITYHQWHSKPEFVVCTHRVVSYADIARSTKQEITDTENTESDTNTSAIQEPTTEDAMDSAIPPSYMSDTSDVYGNSYQNISQPESVKSASAGSTTGTMATSASASASWPRAGNIRYAAGSDTASVSGESRCSQRNGSTTESTKWMEPALVPQHGIGAQYLDPAPYAGAVTVPAVLPLPLPLSTLPVFVSSDQAQMQLQRKHEELQQMIVRQQEELRQVKEQLLLARLGILQPFLNVQHPYMNAEELQSIPIEIIYENNNPRNAVQGYPPQHPPHGPGHHPHMQQ